jgi:hypothetical protein
VRATIDEGVHAIVGAVQRPRSIEQPDLDRLRTDFVGERDGMPAMGERGVVCGVDGTTLEPARDGLVTTR